MIRSSRAPYILRHFVPALIAVLVVPGMWAQMPASSSTTSTPIPGVGHNYIGDLAETVNPSNGSVSLRISTTVPPGRGLTLPFSFAYDSNGINYVGNIAGGGFSWLLPSTTIVSTGGWSESVPVMSFSELVWNATDDAGHLQHCYGFVNYVAQDSNGSRHNLNLTNYTSNSDGGACTYDTIHWPGGFSGDVETQGGEGGYSPVEGAVIASIPTGNGVGVTVGPVTVTQPDGTTYNFPNVPSDTIGEMAASIEDRNGNVVNITPPSTYPTGPYTYTDTLGRTVLQSSGFAISPETVTISGYNAPFTLNWTTLSTPSFVAPTTTVSGSCTSGVGGHQLWVNPITSNGLGAVSTLQLPNGKTFTFTYDPTYKVVNKVTYPSGGYVRYVWGMNSQAEWGGTHPPFTPCVELYGVPVITDRYVSFNGSTEVLHQHFAYSTTWSPNGTPWTSKQTTVTTTDNVRNTSYNTVYTYSPAGGIQPPNTWALPTSADPVEKSVAYYDTSGSLLKTVYKTWANPRLMTSQETQYPSGQANETTWSYNSRDLETERDEYDFGTSGVGSLLRKTATNYQQFTNSNIVDRPCQVITYDSSGTNRVAETDSFYDNGGTTTPCGTAGTPSLSSAGGSSLTGHDEANYSATSTTARGNVTQKTQWLNTGSSPAATYAYDETGQVVSATDPNGNTTSYSYTDSYLNTNSTGYTTTAGAQPSGTVTDAYLTQMTHPVTNGFSHIDKFSYGYNDGELTQFTDQDTQNTTYKYNDSLGRLTETDSPDGGQTTLSFNDTTPSVTTTKLITSSLNLTSTSVMDGLGHVIQTQLTTDPDGTTYSATAYDGNGKPYQAYNPTRCSTPTTNCGTETTWGFTTYLYDGAGRTCLVVPPDGTVPSSLACPTTAPAKSTFTSYAANQTTVTDQVGHQRTSQVDGLGRLTFVWEAPNATGYNYETDYAYDTFGNLIGVKQKGGNSNSANWRPRTFTYDSLSRLVCAANPEVQIVTCPASATGTLPNGAITYGYDLNSNVSSKVAPKPGQTSTATVTTNYTYDALNRLTQKSYVGVNTSSSQYGYDGTKLTGCGQNPPAITSPTNLLGRRSAMCSGASGSSWSYDSMGRPLLDVRVDNAGQQIKYSVGYTYNLDGSIKTLTYPSGDVLTYTPGGAGRLLGVSDSSNTYVAAGSTNRATYAPTGSLATMVNGYTSTFAGIVTSNLYNDRLQPMLLSASASSSQIFSLCYDFHLGVVPAPTNPCSLSASSTGDNGSVFQILNNVDSTRSAAFQYDPLNRISQANTTNTTSTNCWGETYTIDPWGNLTNRAPAPGMGSNCFTEGLNQAPATTQNQLPGITYDAAGNVTNDGVGDQPTYDAENRIIGDAGVTYAYDADGVRMEKSSGTKYWFGPAGAPLTETSLTGTINEEYVYFDGERIARIDRPSGTVHYYFSNHLGSASVITSATGVIQEQMDFYPFGGVAYSSGSDTNHYKFTGKERDSESGLDNFGARYFASNVGRFMTPDWAARPTAVPYALFGDPQSLNLYIYVRNDPVTRADADGHQGAFCPTPDNSSGCKRNPDSSQVIAGKDVQGQNLDGKLHVTPNADGTKTSYQGTTSTTTTKDANGNVTSSTTKSSVTTQTLNAHGDIDKTSTTTSSTTYGANGKVTGSSTSTVGLQDNSAQAQSMRTDAISFLQHSLPDLVPMPKSWAPGVIDLFRGFTGNDAIDAVKAFGEGASHASYGCAKAGIDCY